jgi:hypothetical protein
MDLQFINKAIQDTGATHILNVKINDNGIHRRFYNFIHDRMHNYDFCGKNYQIKWIGNGNGCFYTVSIFIDQVILAHTRKIIIDFIHLENKNKEQLEAFQNCSFVYSVTKTVGFINQIDPKVFSEE